MSGQDMTEQLPPPLVPAEVDCTDLDGFMLNAERLMASELVALSSHEVIGAALLLWCRAWKQRPAASLPNDEKVMAAFSRMPLQRFRKLREEVLRGFVLCSDGRLYHSTLAKEAINAYERKVTFQRKREADAERLRNWRSGKREETQYETHSETRFVAEGQGQGQGQGHVVLPNGSTPAPKAPPARKRASPPALDTDALAALGVDRQHAVDWLAVRKAKDLPLTRTAWDQTAAEAAKAGITPAEAVRLSAANGWAGFRASWLARQDAPTPVPGGAARPVNRQLAVEAENRRVAAEWLAQEAARDAATTQTAQEASSGSA